MKKINPTILSPFRGPRLICRFSVSKDVKDDEPMTKTNAKKVRSDSHLKSIFWGLLASVLIGNNPKSFAILRAENSAGQV